jgi:hypothetical protein
MKRNNQTKEKKLLHNFYKRLHFRVEPRVNAEFQLLITIISASIKALCGFFCHRSCLEDAYILAKLMSNLFIKNVFIKVTVYAMHCGRLGYYYGF